MPKHRPGKIVTFKNGAKAKVMPNGRMRIISGPKKKKGGGIAVGGGLKKRKKRGGSIRIGGGMGMKKMY